MTEVYEQATYDSLPEHMRDGARGYIEDGEEPGHFLRAVLENDLTRAYRYADGENLAAMAEWVHWLIWEIPAPAWGSPSKVNVWIAERRAEREVPVAATHPGPDRTHVGYCSDCRAV